MSEVTLVIPGRDCARTLEACLGAATAILHAPGSPLREIVFVDDGSRDATAEIAARFPVTLVRGRGAGPGAARNLGWRIARTPLVWFVDADCVAHPDALDRLVPHLETAEVAAVGGSYGIANAASLLSRLIHEEIVERHLAMPIDVDFLATFNVLYRRSALEALGGFDERYLKAQDAELSFRATAAGHRLCFERASLVDHYHEERIGRYLRTQRQQGYWRVWLHLEHPGHAARNSYSSALDHLQPPLALLAAGSVAGAPVAALLLPSPLRAVAALACAALPAALAAMQAPMTLRLLRRTRDPRMLAFVPLGAVRALWRGIGMAQGTLRRLATRRRS